VLCSPLLAVSVSFQGENCARREMSATLSIFPGLPWALARPRCCHGFVSEHEFPFFCLCVRVCVRAHCSVCAVAQSGLEKELRCFFLFGSPFLSLVVVSLSGFIACAALSYQHLRLYHCWLRRQAQAVLGSSVCAGHRVASLEMRLFDTGREEK
jgi:hypothetical protein